MGRRQRRTWSIGGALSSVGGAISSAASSVAGAVSSFAGKAFDAAKTFGCGMSLADKAEDFCKSKVGGVISSTESIFTGKFKIAADNYKKAVVPCLDETLKRFCDEMAAAAWGRRMEGAAKKAKAAAKKVAKAAKGAAKKHPKAAKKAAKVAKGAAKKAKGAVKKMKAAKKEERR